MTEKELRALSKLELLEMLRRQELEIEQLTVEKDESVKQLGERRVTIEEAGSLADASLVLSGVMKAAQDAADVYLDNIKNLEAKKEAMVDKLEQETTEKIAYIYAEAEHRRAQAEEETKKIIDKAWKFMEWHSEQLNKMRAEFKEKVNNMGPLDS